jgi:hypothetical protein
MPHTFASVLPSPEWKVSLDLRGCCEDLTIFG